MSSAAATDTAAPPSKGLNIALWIAQVLMGVLFAFAGFAKTFNPIAELAVKMSWVNEFSPGMVRFVGISELLGGVGLILPAATRILPKLTPLAGAALALVMVLAAGFHLMHSEPQGLPVNLVLGGLCAFVAWGRFKKAPIAPR